METLIYHLLDCTDNSACGYGAYCFLTEDTKVGCKCKSGFRGRTQIGKEAICTRIRLQSSLQQRKEPQFNPIEQIQNSNLEFAEKIIGMGSGAFGPAFRRTFFTYLIC